MIPRPLLAGATALLCLTGLPSDLSAQLEVTGRAGTIRLGGRLHAQMATSPIEDAPGTNFFIRRARITLDVTISDFLTARVMPDFVGGLQDAWVRFDFDPALQVSMGQFKRAFDLFEIASSTQLPVVERDGRIPGLSACPGPGSICSLSRFTERLGYAGRDMGVQVEGSLGGGTVSWTATLTNGTGIADDLGEAAEDDDDGKSFAGRLVAEVAPGARLNLGASMHDRPGTGEAEEEEDRATAIEVGLELGAFEGGPHLMAAVVSGENWLAPVDVYGGDARFLTAQGILSWYRPMEHSSRFAGWEPVLRVSWGDPGTDVEDDAGFLFTPGLFLYVRGRNRIGANLDVWSLRDADTEASFKLMTFLYF